MYIEICNFDRDWDNFKKISDGGMLYEILKIRKMVVVYYVFLIKKVFDNKDEVYLCIGSIIYLYCNCLFGIDRELENKIFILCRYFLYV